MSASNNEFSKSNITVGQLVDELLQFGRDCEITFGSSTVGAELKFYRTKRRGSDLVQIELNEDFPQPGRYTVTVGEDGGHWIDAPYLK